MAELARHSTCAPFACNAPLVMRIERSHRSCYEELVVYRCEHCGRVAESVGVIPAETLTTDDGA
jgi:hypothetical protein